MTLQVTDVVEQTDKCCYTEEAPKFMEEFHMVQAAFVRRLALGQIFYLLMVILFGAYVRASGSGAGCGNHWPLCNGEVIPTSPALKTIIEFTHRTTSGLTLPFALLILYFVRKAFPKGDVLRFGAWMTVLFVLMEGLIGAGLVRFEHVAENRSVYRAFSMGLHLVNTFTLMAFATLTGYWASLRERGQVWQAQQSLRSGNVLPWLLLLGLCGILLTGISGAVTALGDTLFPVQNGAEAWQLSSSSAQHLFVRLRIYHPFIAVGLGAYLVSLAKYVSSRQNSTRPLGLALSGLVLFQLFLGYFNVQLFAPIGLQLAHLLTAEILWVVYIVFAAQALSRTWTTQEGKLKLKFDPVSR